MRNRTNYLFVSETPVSWTVWHILDIPDYEVYPALMKELLPTRDGQYIWPQAHSFWTFDRASAFMNDTVQLWDESGESTDVQFL